MNISLIITVYKATDFLNRVLESVKRQSLQPNELIIAEDGEYGEMAQLVESWRPRLDYPVIHVTQKDIGNRKPLVQNKAILKSRGDYLLFVDGDCVLRSDYIQAHADFAEEGTFQTGRRVELSPKATEFLTAERIASGYLEGIPWRLLWDGAFGETHHWARFLKTPKPFRGLLGQDKVDDIRGCNFSVRRNDMYAINGFTNHFSGAYGEDSDVEYRLKFSGLRMKSNKGAAIQYHLWHKVQTKDLTNQKLLEEVLARKVARTENGLEQAPAIP
jgi:glycosyltransferase involved in cell wall biosynthesis